jgi:hypothetical protein
MGNCVGRGTAAKLGAIRRWRMAGMCRSRDGISVRSLSRGSHWEREWRVTIELGGVDGTRQTQEVARGGGADPHSMFDPLGLTLDDGMALLAGVQRHVVQARVSEYCAVRRRCPRCLRLWARENTRTRRLKSLFGTVEVLAPRFKRMRGHVANNALPGIGTHARPMHPRIQADIGEDGRLAAVSSCPAASVRVLSARRRPSMS